MQLGELARRLGVAHTGPADHEVRAVRDIERLPATAPLADDGVYFVESEAVLKRHPLAGPDGVVLTTTALQARFARALIAPDGQERLAFIALLRQFDVAPRHAPGISAAASVDPRAVVDPTAAILPGAVVMEGAVVGARCTVHSHAVVEPWARVGAETTLHPGVVLGHHCEVGERCVVHAATVIGADGFGFHHQGGRRYKVPQIGNVEIADDVEIGAGCTIDRATIDTTRVGAHTKIDDQVHIGHNCQVGRGVVIVGNTAVGGSVEIGDGSMISGMVCILDHVRLAPGTLVMGVSGVIRDTESGQAYQGMPARPARTMHRIHAALERLPALLGRVRAIERKLAGAEANGAEGADGES